METTMLRNKTILITGGTGSFGNAIASQLINSTLKEIRIFSRDEKKQHDMRRQHKNNKLKFYIGDVRDKNSVESAIHGVDFIFHAAALKQVPSCEFFPMEAVKTNVIGTENVLDLGIKHQVSKIVCLSTDKAVYPINAMGISKAMMEKIMVSKSRGLDPKKTTICGTRYGNVIASRGSVIPLFIDQIRNKQPLTITNPEMTRFMMSLDQAIDLVLHAFKSGSNGDLFVQKSPAASIKNIAKAICNISGQKNHPIEFLGTRHAEKLYEVLCSTEEMSLAEDQKKYYRIPPDKRDLNYEIYLERGKKIKTLSDYNSHNTTQLTVQELEKLFNSLKVFEIDP